MADPVAQVLVKVSDRWRIVTKQGREWNAMAKESITDVLREHHTNTIPGHFNLGAHSKYGYSSRSSKTKELKRRRGMPPGLDLVKFGRVRQIVTNTAKVTIRGSYSSGGLDNAGSMVATLRMGKFPFPVAAGGTARGIGPAKMRQEIAAVTSDQAFSMVKKYRDGIRRRLMARRSMQLARGIYRR